MDDIDLSHKPRLQISNIVKTSSSSSNNTAKPTTFSSSPGLPHGRPLTLPPPPPHHPHMIGTPISFPPPPPHGFATPSPLSSPHHHLHSPAGAFSPQSFPRFPGHPPPPPPHFVPIPMAPPPHLIRPHHTVHLSSSSFTRQKSFSSVVGGANNNKQGKSAFDFTLEDDVSLERDLIPGNNQPYSSLNADKMDGNDSDNMFSDKEEMMMPMQNKEAMKELLDQMTSEQLQRYELYRRAHLSKGTMKRILQSILSQPVSSSTTIVFSGCGKLFIGEIVELAKEYMNEIGDTGAITPDHLREARRRYQKLHKKSSNSSLYKKQLFH